MTEASGWAPCDWCGEPSVTDLMLEDVEPGKPIIRARACAFHANAPERSNPALNGNFRRRRAKGFTQTTIFDVPGVRPGNAITEI